MPSSWSGPTARGSRTDRKESKGVSTNPLLHMSGDQDELVPILELKSRLILYLPNPPGPVTARRIYDLYMECYGTGITYFRSTELGDFAEPWTPESRIRFERQQLPALRQGLDWGYLFGADSPTDARIFMFHGSRPASEPGWASVIRFDFEWDFDPVILREFAVEILEGVECVCGTAGYVLCPDEGDYAAPAYDLMFAWAMRYWGAEAQDLDAIMEYALTGFPCISWLTIIGPELQAKDLSAVDRAKAVTHSWFDAGGHVVIQAEERPRLIDRNRREPLGNYPAVAKALLPFQAPAPSSFAGDLWDEDNTRRYLRRFTHPTEV